MLTLVGKDQNTITMYMNGKEIGNVSTRLSFGYFPPTDARYYADYYYYLDDGPDGIYGTIVPTIQTMTIGGWDGAIDEMTFIENPLSSAQVKALYEETKPIEIIHTVTQGVIVPTVTPEEASFKAPGGDGSVQVTVAGNTQWTAESGAGRSGLQC